MDNEFEDITIEKRKKKKEKMYTYQIIILIYKPHWKTQVEEKNIDEDSSIALYVKTENGKYIK